MAIVFDENTELLQPRSNQPFSIHLPDSAWVVRAGNLDLFISRTAGAQLGARHHILRVEQGRALFGMRPIEPDGVSIVATATPGTKLWFLSQSNLRLLGRQSNPPVDFDPLTLLEEWISILSVAAALTSPPKSFTELRPGSIVELGDDAKPVMPATGIVWIKHLQGSSHFLGKQEIGPIRGPSYFPVSARGWLEPEPKSTMAVARSQDWEQADPEWESLQSFHSKVLECLILNQRFQEDKDRKRLLRLIDSGSAITRAALRSLASPLRKDGSLPSRINEDLADPVLRACEAAGKAIGVEIIEPPEMRTSLKPKDPVASIAKASSLRYRRVVLRGKWWVEATGPMIAFRDSDSRPMALLPRLRENGYELYDPVEQTSVPVTASAALTLNGFAYVLYRPFPSRELSLIDLVIFGIRGLRRELTTIVVMGIAGGLLSMILPIATGIIFQTLIPGGQRTQLLEISGFLVFTALATSMFALTRGQATLRLEGKLGSSLQAAVWDRLLRLPAPFFRHYTSGDLADRSLGVEYILETLTISSLTSIFSAVFSMFSFLLLFYYSARLAMIATGLILVAVAVSAVAVRFQVQFQRRIFQIRGRISGMVLEFVENIGKLRVSASEPRAFATWAREFSGQKQLAMSARGVSNGLAVFNATFPVISLAVIFVCAARLMEGESAAHALTAGMFLAFLAAFTQFQSAALSLTSTLQSVLGIVPLFERAAPIFETLPEVNVADAHPGELTGSIEVNHINFRYRPDTPLVLRDFSLTLTSGEFVAVVGPSGSGKSTLLRLLIGFEKPESGAIYYDGQDLAGLDIQAIRQQLGVVIQGARVASGTILTNIIGAAPLTLDEAWAAAGRAGLDRDIREMPMGMHTVVSEGGGNLSGGQRQRLLIARAMVKKPRIFMFDEATSALDNQTQAIVSRSLEAIQATRIVIAHRLSTVALADRIVVVDRGVLVQMGTYDELVNQEGLFRELAKRQLT